MTVALTCIKCAQPPTFPGLPPAPEKPLRHCYGNGDQPGRRGVIGSGTFCPCECRRWPHQPAELYRLAATEHPDDHEAMLGRYRELMIEHGHLIPGTPKPLPCGWPPGAAMQQGRN